MKVIAKYLAKLFYFVLNRNISFRVVLRKKEDYQKISKRNTLLNYFVYWLLIFDKKRNKFYNDAINNINPSDIVVEVGTGFSAYLTKKIIKNRPKEIITYEENTDSFLKAKKVLSPFGNITLLNNSPHNIPPDKNFNVVVQEIIGSIASAEGVAFSMKRLIPFKSKHAKYIPHSASTLFLPVEKKKLNFLESCFDWIFIGKEKAKTLYRFYNFPIKKELSEPQVFESLVFEQNNCKKFNNQQLFKISQDGAFSGLLFYIEVRFGEHQVLNTKRDKTNWSTPFLKLFKNDIPVEKGDTILVNTEIDLSKKEPSYKIILNITTKKQIFMAEYSWEVISRWQTSS